MYNNAKSRGGRLKTIPDRLFVVDEKVDGSSGFLTKSSIHQKPKYVNRKNFDDITILVGLVVRHSLIADQFERFIDIFLFQLPQFRQYKTTQAVLNYLKSDATPTADNYARFAANTVSIFTEAIFSK